MARNRVIYQSKALFIAPNSTGVQTWPKNVETATAAKSYSEADIANENMEQGTGLLYKLDRVQSCNFGFTINRQDVNEFGKLARLGTIVNEPPTVNLDYSYYITDGLNERLMGFNFGGTTVGTAGAPTWDAGMALNAGALSGFLSETQGQNYYILTVNEGEDVIGSNTDSTDSVIGIGNGFVTDYSFTASVGEIPTATVTVEGFNIKSDVGSGSDDYGHTGSSPAVYTASATEAATRITGYNKYYKINPAQLVTGSAQANALRPGDIVLEMGGSTATDDTFVDAVNVGTTAINVQSFGFSIPLARTTLSRLGTLFGYNRVVEVPLSMDVTINAMVNEMVDKDLFDVLCGNQTTKNFTLTLNECADVGSTPTPRMKFGFRGAILTSENHTTDIGGNEMVDLTYNIQIGGANDADNGLFMSGSYNPDYNADLAASYPTGDMPIGGLKGIITGFYGIGTARNY